MGGSPRKSSRTSRAERRPNAGPRATPPVSTGTGGRGQDAARVTKTETTVKACVAVSSRVAQPQRFSPPMKEVRAARPRGGRAARAMGLVASANPKNRFSCCCTLPPTRLLIRPIVSPLQRLQPQQVGAVRPGRDGRSTRRMRRRYLVRICAGFVLEHRSSIHAACWAVSGRPANTCRLWTTAHRRRSNTFFRTPQ